MFGEKKEEVFIQNGPYGNVKKIDNDDKNMFGETKQHVY